MALRILTGIVNITRNGPKSGTVSIGFNPHQQIDGDVGLIERTTLGPQVGSTTSRQARPSPPDHAHRYRRHDQSLHRQRHDHS